MNAAAFVLDQNPCRLNGDGVAGPDGAAIPFTGPAFVSHHALARTFGVSSRTILAWVQTGAWPLPHHARGATLFYSFFEARSWLLTGRWPPDARFLTRWE